MEKDETNMRYEFKDSRDYEEERIRRMAEYLNEVSETSIELNRGLDEIKERSSIDEKKEK